MKICTKQWMDGSYRTGSSLRFYRHATCFLGRMAKMTIPILVPSKQHQYNRKPISYNARLRKDKGPLFYDKNGQIYSLLIDLIKTNWINSVSSIINEQDRTQRATPRINSKQ
eukprot:15171_1